MSSPKIVAFFLFDEATGVPLTGATPTFATYQDDLGVAVAQPAITEIGGGAYKFTPTFPTDRAIIAMLNGGAGTIPQYQGLFLRPEDYAIDEVSADTEFIRKMKANRRKLHTSGPDAGKWITYDDDGVTPIHVHETKNAAGQSSTVDVYEVVPEE